MLYPRIPSPTPANPRQPHKNRNASFLYYGWNTGFWRSIAWQASIRAEPRRPVLPPFIMISFSFSILKNHAVSKQWYFSPTSHAAIFPLNCVVEPHHFFQEGKRITVYFTATCCRLTPPQKVIGSKRSWRVPSCSERRIHMKRRGGGRLQTSAQSSDTKGALTSKKTGSDCGFTYNLSFLLSAFLLFSSEACTSPLDQDFLAICGTQGYQYSHRFK